jgi:endonuclease III related protein
MQHEIKAIYKKLYARFGPQRWWPADTPFEVMVGAILTQNTSWGNVEKAIDNIKRNKLLAPIKLHVLSHARLAFLIRPAGYYNIKAKRLKNFLDFFVRQYQCSIKKASCEDTFFLREQLLSVSGIGPETADSMLLYALERPVFVVDAYTRRVLSRHGLVAHDADYAVVQDLFMENLKPDVQLFNEFHALLVRLGKEFCLKNKPRCALCPLK